MGFIENKVAAEMAQWQGFKDAEINSEKIAQALTRPPKPDMGDLAFATFRFAKDAGMKPPELATKLAHGAETGGLIDAVTAAGPYLNLTLNRTAVTSNVLTEIENQSAGAEPKDWRYGDSESGRGKTLVIDLSSPNIAKPLAVHHLRSTMIGYSIKKLRESQGWRVVGINHLGDWGTGFGRLVAGLKADPAYGAAVDRAANCDVDALRDISVQELNSSYQKSSAEIETNKSLANNARQEFQALESYIVDWNVGGEEPKDERRTTFWLWRGAREVSLREFERIYDLLFGRDPKTNEPQFGFKRIPTTEHTCETFWKTQTADDYRRFGFFVGESHYVMVQAVVDRIAEEASEKGLLETSDGAEVIRTHGKKHPPLMIYKSDGATSYHARDLASAVYRQSTFDGDVLAYAVGAEQSLHFKQLFKALELLGYEWATQCKHVDFGLLLFKQADGKWAKTSTRKGTAIMLEDLLDEATKAVREIMREKNPELAGTEKAEHVAQAVGVGAVVFNDLKNGRRNDVKFDWDAVLDFEGESGPYMLYQYVRMGSVTDKFCERYGEPVVEKGCAGLLELDEEWKIVQQLAAFPDAVAKASSEFEPSIVARHLIELASLTSSWWTATKDTRIVGDDENLSLARVRLVNSIRKVLGRGLTLLGMSLVERM